MCRSQLKDEPDTMQDAAFVCIDWGTTHCRLWVVAGNGHLLAERLGLAGMSMLKPSEYESVLESELAELGVPPTTPAIICGMAGSAQGWHEAPYVDLPTRLTSIPHKSVRASSGKRDIKILPGLAQRLVASPDVIRGEEMLLLGALLAKGVSGTVCLPGTHSKWVEIDDGIVSEFSTMMTGEIFALLAKNSTLAHFISNTDADLSQSAAFADAVGEAMAAPEKVVRALFSVRSTPLLMGAERASEMPARLSGLLIGLEIAGMGKVASDKVTLISNGGLAQSYASAYKVAGLEIDLLEADEIARSGLFYAAKSIWENVPANANRTV